MNTNTEIKNHLRGTLFKKLPVASITLLLLWLAATNGQAQTYTVLHNYGDIICAGQPNGPLVQGPDGAFYGTTQYGSNSMVIVGGGAGTIFKVNPDGSGFTVLKYFNGNDGAGPGGGLVLSGTNFYGVSGGTNGDQIFSINMDGSGFAILKQFVAGSEGWGLLSPLVLSGSTLYGVAQDGGPSGFGTVFKINTDGSGFMVLKSFAGSDGSIPGGSVVLSGSTLYGTTIHGGASASGGEGGYGTLFKLNTDGSGFTVLKNFGQNYNYNDGVFPNGQLVLSGATLYGTTPQGGTNNIGTVFKVNTDGRGFTVLTSFTGSDCSYPVAGLVLSGNTLYGTTSGDNDGTVFCINTDGTGFSVLKNFNWGDGSHPESDLTLSSGTLYGTTPSGCGLGTIFKINTNGTGFTVLRHFTLLDAGGPQGKLVLSGATLYGTTYEGGSSAYVPPYPVGEGTAFKIDVDGSHYSIFACFQGANGSHPSGALALSGVMLYGTTETDGVSNCGTIFRVNTDNGDASTLKNFNSYEGNPCGGVVLSGSALYGMTGPSGPNNFGSVFTTDTNGNGFTVLKSFNDWHYGENPAHAGLVLSGTTLYGTTLTGGVSNLGTIFRINTDGSGFTLLKQFMGYDGNYPESGLTLSGATLYGTTSRGGISNCGTIFMVNTDGTGYTVLRQFTGSDGSIPLNVGGLVVSGTTLYGTTEFGGISNQGTLFSLNTDGSGFTILKQFTYPEVSPQAGLVLSGNTLYGVAGAIYIFALGYPPAVPLSAEAQTAELGATVDFSIRITGSQPLSFQWFFNGTNLISCGTDGSFVLSNVDFSQSGTYTLVVTNVFGAVTSAPVTLNVIPPVEHRPVPAINLMGDVGASLNVEYSDVLGSLANWLPLDMVNLTNPPQYCFDVSTPLPPQRFYRAWQTGTPAVVPSLSPPLMVPAITLSGNIGDALELDYINQFGPTNAWVPLATVTLTNTSQLYFDMSAPGRLARLYRILPVP
jgi:uncharacterized repeat protein (TIGR03803 family)